MMKYQCWSELCQITKDCECKSPCCQGYTIHPLVIEYMNDDLVLTNNRMKTTNKQLIYNLVIAHECPFCVGYVEG